MPVVYVMRFRIPSFAGPDSDGFRARRVSVPDHMFLLLNPESAFTFSACATKISHLRAASDDFALNDRVNSFWQLPDLSKGFQASAQSSGGTEPG